MGSFGHAIGFDDGRIEGFFELFHYLRRQRGRRRADETQVLARPRDTVGVPFRPRQDRLMHGRHSRIPGRFYFIEPAEHLQRIETRRTMNARTGAKRRQYGGNQSVNVKQRHDVETLVSGDKI